MLNVKPSSGMNRSRTLRLLLRATLWRTYSRKLAAARIYDALAQREPRKSHREILLMLARNSERSAARYAKCLQRLGAKKLPELEPLGERVWRWLLVRCGTRWALAWLKYVEGSDVHLYTLFFGACTATRTTDDYKAESN